MEDVPLEFLGRKFQDYTKYLREELLKDINQLTMNISSGSEESYDGLNMLIDENLPGSMGPMESNFPWEPMIEESTVTVGVVRPLGQRGNKDRDLDIVKRWEERGGMNVEKVNLPIRRIVGESDLWGLERVKKTEVRMPKYGRKRRKRKKSYQSRGKRAVVRRVSWNLK